MLRRVVTRAVKLPVAFRPRMLTTGPSAPPPPPSGENSDPSTEEIPKKVVVFGGNGFVGQSVCQAALKLGAEVVSINRSGAPAGKPWAEEVQWVRGDIFEPNEYADELSGATGVVSCVGAFGSDAFMERICGDATVVATEAAQKAGVERFVFLSAAGSQHMHLILRGYWKGKQKAEAAIHKLFPEGGVILRAPGIYGNREVGPVTLPLGIIMKPMEMVFSTPPLTHLRTVGPFESLLTPPVSVEVVGRVAAGGALGIVPPGVFLVDDLNKLAKTI